MKWRIITVVNVLCVVSVYTVPVVEAQPNLTLFPESTSTPPIEDNMSIEDKDPQVDVIVVEDIPVPGTNGQLLFSGEVKWGQKTNTGGQIQNVKIDITKATIKNTSLTNVFSLPSDKRIAIVSKSHPTPWLGTQVGGTVSFTGKLASGTLPVPPAPTPKLTLNLFDSGVDFLSPAHISLSATWTLPPGSTAPGPWQMSGTASASGTTTTGAGTTFLGLDEIVIGANQMMEFPNSITADLSSSKAIPVVSPWILGVLALLIAITGGVFITRRHRALGQ